MSPSQEPTSYPNDFSNGWKPYGPEPTREDYANGYGKLAMRKAMYGDKAWGMTSVIHANYRPNREQPSEGLRKFLLQPNHPPGPPSGEIYKREYLLKGSVLDVPAPDATERLLVGPVQRPNPRVISQEPFHSKKPPFRGNQAELSLWPQHTSSRTDRDFLPEPWKPVQESGASDACHHHADLRRKQARGITTPFPAYRRPRTPTHPPTSLIPAEDSNLDPRLDRLRSTERHRNATWKDFYA